MDYKALFLTLSALSGMASGNATAAESAIAGQAAVAQLTTQQINNYVQTMRDKYYNDLPVVKFENSELTEEAVTDYITQLTQLSQDLPHDLPIVQQIHESTGQGKWVREWMEHKIVDQIKSNNQRFNQQVESYVRTPFSVLEKAESLSDKTFSSNYSNENKRLRMESDFARISRILTNAAMLEKATSGGSSYYDAAELVEHRINVWNNKVTTMISGTALPADINDRKLTATAEKILAHKDYGIESWEKLIVNSGIRPGERIDVEFKDDKATKVIRRWQEYQVTTVEEETGKLYLYYNTLKNFSQGPSTTPVNRWILSKRTKGGEILETNL